MQKLPLGFVALFLMASSAAARAGNPSGAPFYLSLDMGHVSVNYGSLSLTPSNGGVIDGSGTALTLSVGSALNGYFGVELGYHDYGKPTSYEQSGSLAQSCPVNFSCPHLTGLSGELVGRYEVAPQLDAELRAGALDWRLSSSGPALFAHTTGTEFIYGVGVKRHFNYGLSVDVIYERSTLTTEETRIGLSYSF